jgi:hypothetical protein
VFQSGCKLSRKNRILIQGALMEIGPFRIRGQNLVENEGSWHEFANLLFGSTPLRCLLNWQWISLLAQGLAM